MKFEFGTLSSGPNAAKPFQNLQQYGVIVVANIEHDKRSGEE